MEKICHRLFVSDDKQEKWLNKMMESGWELKERALLQYIFKPNDERRKQISFITTERLLRSKKGKAFMQFLIDQECTIICSHATTIYYTYSGDLNELKGSKAFITIQKNRLYSNLVLFLLYLIVIAFVLSNSYVTNGYSTNNFYLFTPVGYAVMWFLLSLIFLYRAVQSFREIKRRTLV